MPHNFNIIHNYMYVLNIKNLQKNVPKQQQQQCQQFILFKIYIYL